MIPEGASKNSPRPTRAPRGGLQLMALILVAMALLSIYSNVRRAHRAQIETVTIISPPTAQPSPAPSPTTP